MSARTALPARHLLPAIACILLIVLGGAPAAARPCTPGTNKAAETSNATSANGTSADVPASNSTAGGNASNATVAAEEGGTGAMSNEEKAAAKKEEADAKYADAQAKGADTAQKGEEAYQSANDKTDLISDTLANKKDQIVAGTHQDLFPNATIPQELEAAVAAVLILFGLVNCALGLQLAKPLFIVTAFLGGTVGAMYPVDAVLGNILCVTFECDPNIDASKQDKFCEWSMAAGLGVGMMAAGSAGRIFDAGMLMVGAGLGLIPALLLQPVVDQILADAPQWTHYIHYFCFAALGAGVAKLRPDYFIISFSSVFGAMVWGMAVSYFADAGFTPTAISNGTTASDAKSIGIAAAASVLAVMGFVFQGKMKQRRDARDNGGMAADLLEDAVAEQRVLIDQIKSREVREEAMSRELARAGGDKRTFCHSCGAKVHPAGTFCNACGEAVTATTAGKAEASSPSSKLEGVV